ncbi:MAG TPA: thioredoxin family protein [Pirellulales bacterium]|nr:thioredoxin family protein [Pirellulales bacterium]
MKRSIPRSAFRIPNGSLCTTAGLRFPALLACAALAILYALPAVGIAGKFNRELSIGDPAPEWKGLVGTDDRQHALADYANAKLIVLVFTCNHCPVATANQERLIALQKDYRDQSVRLIAICCNPGEEDNLAAMQERARQRRYNFPYLYDASQASGRAYGVRQTPTVFLLDRGRKVAYMGAIDDSWGDAAQVERDYLRDAIDSLLAVQKVPIAETRPQGCEIPYLETKSDASGR